MTPEEQRQLAAQALQSYQGPPQPAMPALSTPGQTWASDLPDAAIQGYTQSAVPPGLPEAAIQGYGQPGLPPADQQALAQGALAQWTDPNKPGPGAVTDEQLLAAVPPPAAAAPPEQSAPPAAALAAVPPSAVAATEQPQAVQEAQSLPPPEAQAAPPPPEPAPTPSRPAARNFQQAVDNFVAESEEEGAAEKKKAAQELAGALANANLTKEQAADITERLKRHNAVIDEQVADIKRTKALMEAAQAKADESSNIEHKESTRSKVGSLLMLMGGLLGDGLARLGGNNNTQYLKEAQAGIDKFVEMDLAKQRERYHNNKEAAKRAGDNYAMAVQMFGKTPEADAFTQILTGQQYAAEMAAQMAQSKSEVVRANGVLLKEARDTDTAQKVAELMAGISRARLSGAGRAAVDNRTYSAKELYEKRERGEPLTAREDAIASKYADDMRSKRGADFREETAEEKALAAQADERREIAAGWKRLPNQRKLEQADIRQIVDIQKNAIDLTETAKEAARLWGIVMDPTTPEPERAKARVAYNARRNDYLSSLSVGTGQGTITKSDAERTGNDAPTLPLDKAGWVKASENWAKGEDPSRAYQDAAIFYQSKADAKLRGLGNAPSEEADAKWAEWDAKHPPKKPKGETPQSKPTASQVPEGKVALIRVSDGKPVFLKKEDEERAIASKQFRAP